MKLLILTSVYPSPDDEKGTVTKVVQFFAKQWSADGHEVIVIHNTHRYPAVIHCLPKRMRQGLADKLSFYIPPLSSVKPSFRMDDVVKVYKLPIRKIIPHGDHPKSVLDRHADRIKGILTENHFVPDLIIAHWMSPQIQLIARLKQAYHCRCSLVLHGRGYLNDPKFDVKQYLRSVDALGCRSRSEAEYAQQTLGLKTKPYVCYSGVPDQYVQENEYHAEKFSAVPKQWKFIYVGRLVGYKNIPKMLEAFSRIRNQNYLLEIIGSGGEEATIRKKIAELGLSGRVLLLGQVSRDEVIEHMKAAHSFVMISKGEVFGLVYLEAMATSCITIGSRGEGIDGIIRDQENGLLCEPADDADLEKTLNRLMEQPAEQLRIWSFAGYQTARAFTDSIVAKRYLSDVMNWENK